MNPIDGNYYRAFLEHGNFINTLAGAMFSRVALERVDDSDEKLRVEKAASFTCGW
jgi:hypothetical protein